MYNQYISAPREEVHNAAHNVKRPQKRRRSIPMPSQYTRRQRVRLETFPKRLLHDLGR